jgi:hypothetical protein
MKGFIGRSNAPGQCCSWWSISPPKGNDQRAVTPTRQGFALKLKMLFPAIGTRFEDSGPLGCDSAWHLIRGLGGVPSLAWVIESFEMSRATNPVT